MALNGLSKAKLPREVNAHIAVCRDFIAKLDAEMKKPSDVERGRRIAALANGLEMATDRLEHFGIKEPRRRKAPTK